MDEFKSCFRFFGSFVFCKEARGKQELKGFFSYFLHDIKHRHDQKRGIQTISVYASRKHFRFTFNFKTMFMFHNDTKLTFLSPSHLVRDSLLIYLNSVECLVCVKSKPFPISYLW